MPRPNVSVTILDESLVVPTSEDTSATIGAMVSVRGLSLFGNTAEKAQGFYLVNDVPNWFSRLNTVTQTQNNLAGASGLTFMAGYLGAIGATAWTEEWYSVFNFLQYGSPCYVGFNNSAGSSGFYNVNADVIFAGSTHGESQNKTFYNYRVSQESPAFGVFSVPGITSSDLDANPITTITNTGGLSSPEFTCYVYGRKNQLNVAGTADTLISTLMGPDVAGCLSRTDRTSYPWFSPAGVRRGQILNVVSLVQNLTTIQQDNLYDFKVNPIVTFPGEGTILFGDKTFAAATSSMSSINVSRLVIYMKKILGPLARGILFEQNDSLTRNRFKNAADSVLREIQSGRGISDYKIICDESNNTPEIIEAKTFVADVLIKPIPSINYVKITLTNKDLSDTL